MSDPQRLAETCIGALHARDPAARALGIEIRSIAAGEARLAMRVRPDMLNGHGLCHGGLIFAFADTAFAYACNSYNETSLAASASIEFLAPARVGDELTAETKEQVRVRRHGIYDVEVTNQDGTRIALFRGRSVKVEGTVLGAFAGE
jgi:acyl-CoA thioesterase